MRKISFSSVLKLLFIAQAFLLTGAAPILDRRNPHNHLFYRSRMDQDHKFEDQYAMSIAFTVEHPAIGVVVSGIRGFNGSLDTFDYYVNCLDYKSLKKKSLRPSIGPLSASKRVNYTHPPCRFREYTSDNKGKIWFSDEIYGLTAEDCFTYTKKTEQNHHDCLSDSVEHELKLMFLLWLGCVALGYSILSRLEDGMCGISCRRLITHSYTSLTTFDSENNQLSIYLESIDKSEQRITKLTTNEVEQIEDAHPELCCSVLHALMDKPVFLDGRRYEFDILMKIRPDTDGSRKDPLTRESFTLVNIQADRESRDKIEMLVQKTLSKRKETPRVVLE